MDLIERLGGVSVRERQVRFGGDNVVAAGLRNEPGWSERYCFIENKDFDAEFDGDVWTVRYRMEEGQEPVLRNRVPEYEKRMTPENRSRYEKEIERWISEEILVPWGGEKGGVLPIMPVEQENKGKVRPVLDFRELNRYVECHTGDKTIDVCGEIIREWRQIERGSELIDLKSAYLQIKIVEELLQYQLVKHKGKVYCLTWMGFGLSSAPRIMSRILKTVLGKSHRIRSNTSSYIDDILVDIKGVPTEEVVNHLKSFGLEAKVPEKLERGRALGMKLDLGDDGELQFRRGNEIPECKEEITRRELFSACGKLVGHYPVCNWLRLAMSYMKRIPEGGRWDDKIGENARKVYGDIVERTKRNDPVRGCWHVRKTESGRVWCDASNLGIGVVVEIERKVVEDAAWMTKKEDHHHINVTELEAVLRGVNLGIKWGLKNIEIVTDSVTVRNWVALTLVGERRVRTKGVAEMLIKRRLGTMKSVIDELGLRVEVSHVESEKNKADALTRVESQWRQFENEEEEGAMCALTVRQGHESHHMGVERTWYQAKKVDPKVTKEEVKRVVRGCEECQSIDPAPVRHERGNLLVNDNWKRIALDVTHYRCSPYLSLVDCSPGRFVVWKKLKESAEEVCERLEELFLERGPVNEVLMDNGPAFRSEGTRMLLERWKVTRLYRAAYRQEGNRIVERHRRTIKAMAERGNMSPREAVFWYNSSPRYGQREEIVSSRSIFTYDWRHPEVKGEESEEARTDGKLSVGDEVWVKPPKGGCTKRWKRGMVKKANSSNNLEVDGTPWHMLDLRKVVEHDGEEAEQDEEEEDVDSGGGRPERSERARQRPRWLDDYEC